MDTFSGIPVHPGKIPQETERKFRKFYNVDRNLLSTWQISCQVWFGRISMNITALGHITTRPNSIWQSKGYGFFARLSMQNRKVGLPRNPIRECQDLQRIAKKMDKIQNFMHPTPGAISSNDWSTKNEGQDLTIIWIWNTVISNLTVIFFLQVRYSHNLCNPNSHKESNYSLMSPSY